MKTQYSRTNDWSMPEPPSTNVISQNKNNLTNTIQDQSINQAQPNNQEGERSTLSNSPSECFSSVTSFLCGLLLGILSNGLILAIISSLWLTSGNKKASTTTHPSAQLRWNSTGITILDTVGIPGTAPNQTNVPFGLAFDSLGALYVADYFNNRVQKLTIGTSTVVTVAGKANGTGGAGSYYLYQPVQMAFDSNNNIYLSDRGNNRVQFFISGNLSGTTVAGIAGLGGGSNQLDDPSGIAFDSNTGNLYIADTYNQRVMQYQNGASFGTVAAGGNGYGLASSQLSNPFGLYFDTFSNSFIIPNSNAQNVVRWRIGDFNWTLLVGSSTGIAGNNSISLNWPVGVTLDRMGNIYVADTSNHRIQLFLYGQSIGTTIAGITGVYGTSSTMLKSPFGVVLDNQLNLYVSDSYNNRVQMFKRY